MNICDILPEVYTLAEQAEEKCREQFERIDRIAKTNTFKVMKAFADNHVSESCFAGTTGYGYDDLGRDTLDKIFAEIFHTEDALVRIGLVNGTHAISCAYFALADPGQTILTLTGTPYDTIRSTVGSKEEYGTLEYYGIHVRPGRIEDLTDPTVAAVTIQRSCGYEDRPSLSVEQIRTLCDQIRSRRSDVTIFCDNCYGEFVEDLEPTDVGCDLVAGSLIKNLGGGIAPTGAYIAGRKNLVERAAKRMTCPSIGGECGCTLGNNRLLYQGLFLSPHVVAQALKTAVFASAMCSAVGLETKPAYDEVRHDLITRLSMKTAENMLRFCEGIQSGAPVDSYVRPVPADLPGYQCPVIMAAGSFIQGSSIELSCDGPFEEPYNLFLQGGLTYESGRLGVMMAVSAMLSGKN